MAVDKPNAGGPKPAAAPEPKQAPRNESKTPQDNTAAKQSPTATKSALNISFGHVTDNDKGKQPGMPPADTKSAPSADPKKSPGEPGSTVKGKDNQPLKTPDGKKIILDKNKNPIPVASDGTPITDPKGNIYAVDETGKYLQTVDGNYGVYEKTSSLLVAADNTGKIVADQNGYAYVLLRDGKYTNAEGKDIVYDKTGEQVVMTGQQALIPFEYAGAKYTDIYKNLKTKELALTNGDGFTLEVDPATNDLAKDADGLPIVRYNPVDDDPNWPPAKPYDDPQTTIDNLPQGKERGDPLEIKKSFFKNGYLDTDGIYSALAKYNVLDVYNALAKSSKNGGNDIPTTVPEGKTGEVVQPTEEQAKQIVATLIAWANMNGHYAPIKDGQVPMIMLYDSGDPKKPDTGFTGGNRSGILWMSGTSKILPSILAHELNHEFANRIFTGRLGKENGQNLSQLNEAVTEYISTKWTGNHSDSHREDPNEPVNEVKELQNIEVAVKALGKEFGNGDDDKGMDILQRAYFAGDPVAMELFIRAYRKAAGTD
ncbi:hypothetical protein [Noviherbaspirillum denitrificans]|uniref:Uncharacterized protein n=1 Tax=Noviherbaspirillum denitrificans TaxID=1968433 RepID=A0A254TJ80_9BURK|nr:hypothetical protein [Noviherbaspirillum denitrificans]OWW21372.1 hypothetical protein AYR66_19685 [Noviherbaspirillum denitrificans]